MLTFTYQFYRHVHILQVNPRTGEVEFVGFAPYESNRADANRRIAEFNRRNAARRRPDHRA